MTANKRKGGLGRGLDALLGMAAPETAAAPRPAAPPGEARHLPVDVLQRGKYQPRRAFDEASLEELADSIRAQGVVQPIVVRPVSFDRYEIIAGERRWRAAQKAGLHEVPVVIKLVPDEAALAMSLIENIQRENLNPMEECRALQRLVDEFGATHDQAAQAVGRSRAAVSNLLRLHELDGQVKERLERRELEMGHGRALLSLNHALQRKAAEQVVSQGLSVRATEQLVKRLLAEKPATSSPPVQPDVQQLERDLGEKLGAKVRIEQGRKGRGRLVVEYGSLDELDGILAHIR
jgi:ParB family chromosome partitioning protein